MSAIAGLGGVMWGLYQEAIAARMGANLLVPIFIVFIIGGLALAPFLFRGTRSVDTAKRVCVFIVLVASYDMLLATHE